jgi:hypothetical protein
MNDLFVRVEFYLRGALECTRSYSALSEANSACLDWYQIDDAERATSRTVFKGNEPAYKQWIRDGKPK